MADDEKGDPKYAGKVAEDDIALEGYLRVRANHGIVGLRPWLLRYYVLCKDDTLRRYGNADEVENPKKPPRVMHMRDVEDVVVDAPPRFSLRVKSKKVDAEGELIKFTAETDGERGAWLTAFMEVVARYKDEAAADAGVFRPGALGWVEGGRRRRRLFHPDKAQHPPSMQWRHQRPGGAWRRWLPPPRQ